MSEKVSRKCGAAKFDEVSNIAWKHVCTIAEQFGTTPEKVAGEVGEAFRLLSEAKELFELSPECSDPENDRWVWLQHTDGLFARLRQGDGE